MIYCTFQKEQVSLLARLRATNEQPPFALDEKEREREREAEVKVRLKLSHISLISCKLEMNICLTYENLISLRKTKGFESERRE